MPHRSRPRYPARQWSYRQWSYRQWSYRRARPRAHSRMSRGWCCRWTGCRCARVRPRLRGALWRFPPKWCRRRAWQNRPLRPQEAGQGLSRRCPRGPLDRRAVSG
ncbi:conserved hypothetical protein [Streptomyces clavuligerus]|uniref:Uncharacterized protein n=1 Tax=Streptomyces clavuligerus TaxID=1901 RepID=Q6TMS3_STRCL|nr:hypothetical protein pSCL2.5.424.10 [Streptomyces clavuligerus]EDY48743.1 conserved hypothetical protein [Streptomyces clavuligerus]